MTSVAGFIGVYHADGGILGELRYVAGKVFGGRHCALCDITHSAVRRRPEWDRMVASADVPWRLLHLNERDSRVAAACADGTPCVLADLADGSLRVVLGPADLEAVSGDVVGFERLLADRCRDLELG